MSQRGARGGTTIQTGSTPISGVITSFDPTLLLNGQYEVVFRATDTAGRTSATTFDAVVKDNLKVGNFTVSFTDLEVPLAGMPIRVTRTYDSRDKQSGDFGFGWRMDVSNVRLQENGIAGFLWFGQKNPGFLPQYCLEPTKPVVVTVTTPDGRVHEFQPNLTPTCVSGAPPNTVTYGFQPRPGTTTDASLRVAGNDHVIAVGSWPGPMQLYDDGTYQIFDPDTYILSFPDGREFTVHQTTGLKQIKDLNGNILTVNQNGITHSSGLGIAIARDAQGRVTSVTDPDGNAITYGFDANGDLHSVTDREDKETTFTYFSNPAHLLDEIRDPLGRTPIKNEYDATGRLIKHTDAFAKTIEYTHNIGTRQEVVKDRNDKVRVLEYDERGNVVREIQPDGRQILRTFDGRNNRTSETEPHETTNPTPATTTYVYDATDNLLSVTDPNSNTTEYTYNARKQVLTTKDPKGKFTVNSYDVKGNLLSTKSGGASATGPFQSESGYTYTAQGNVATQTVTVGGVSQTTSYLYTGQGHLFRETDANGHVTDYAPSFFGNRLSESETRTTYSCSAGTCTPAGTETVNRSYEYDKNNRLTKTTDPDGSFTRTVYDALGRQKETYDKLNRKTEFTYDDMGRLTKTTYPDVTTDESTYDPEGRRLTSKDRANRTTTYLYDDLGRLLKTTFPDLTFTENFYDAAGRLTSTKDGRGKTTTYEYDSSGRRTKVKDPLNNETVFTYDTNGNQKTIKDARLNTTTYDYDDMNRRTKTTFPDSSFTETAYDELSRRTSEKDQAGKVTQFQYDKLSRLTKVIDALLQETTYGYDELGNRIRQTDANGRSTWFVFDKLGREIQRHLPDGSTESKTYDAVGNLQTRTDFMGRVTTYDYDDNNRLTSRQYPNAAENVSFTYTATGRRLTAVDARGTASYGYDTRDRLTSLTQPGVGSLGYAYDGNGNRTSLTATIGASSYATTYSYDDASRLDLVTDPAARIYDHGYDPNGNRTSLAYPNGTNTSYVYNSLNRLTNLAVTGPLGTVFSQAFTLGPSGNRTRIDENDGITKDYSYDSLYRLTQDKVSDTIGLVYQKDFTYDAVGNRQQQTTVGTGAPGTPTAPGTINYTYDTRDRLLTDAASYGYDSNGNLTSKSGEATYTWDHENRLIGVSKANGATVSYAYDVDGNRIRTTTTPSSGSAIVINNLVDTSGGLSHVVAETDATNTLAALYVRGTGDLLSVMRPAGGGTWNSRFFHADGIGSIRRLTNEAGTITDGYSYTAFGEQIAHTGSDLQPYSFAGEPLDPNSGFQYHRQRWMDPRAGRFNGVDPFDGDFFDPQSLHRYVYAHGNPGNRRDPTGHFTMMEGLFVAALVVGLSAFAGRQYIELTRPTYQITSDRVIKSNTAGFYKYFELQINSSRAKDDFALVQWVEGSFSLFGVPQLVCIRGKEADYYFPSFTVDTCDDDPFISTTPGETGIERFSDHIRYRDRPGRKQAIPPACLRQETAPGVARLLKPRNGAAADEGFQMVFHRFVPIERVFVLRRLGGVTVTVFLCCMACNDSAVEGNRLANQAVQQQPPSQLDKAPEELKSRLHSLLASSAMSGFVAEVEGPKDLSTALVPPQEFTAAVRLGKAAVPPLVALLDSGDVTMRSAAVLVLGQITNKRFGSRDSIKNPATRSQVVAEWAKWWQDHASKTQTEWFIEDLANPDLSVKRLAIAKLGSTGDPLAIAPLRALLGTPLVRMEAADALGRIGDRCVTPYLIELFLPNENVALRRSGIELLKKLTHETLPFEPDAPPANREAALLRWKEWWKSRGSDWAKDCS